MADERMDTLTGALEEARAALRAELRQQEALAREQARLEERRARLTAQREQLLGRLEGRLQPRLPERLAPPFQVQAQRSRRRRLREVLPALTTGVVMLLLGQGHGARVQGMLLVLFLVLVTVLGALYLRRPRRWSLREDGLSTRALFPAWPADIPWRDVVGVEVSTSEAQRRRGVGTVLVAYRVRGLTGLQGGQPPLEQVVSLEDVAEPERLAAWLRAQAPALPAPPA